MDISSHVRVDVPGKCCECGRTTEWMEVNLEAYLCPGGCSEVVWEDYMRATNG